MKKTKLFVIKFGYIEKFFTENEEKALTLWKLLSDSEIKGFHDVRDYNDHEHFIYPEKLEPDLRALKTELYENKEEAGRSKTNYDRAKKAKLITVKKKKP